MSTHRFSDTSRGLMAAALGGVLIYVEGTGTGDDPIVEVWVDGIYQGHRKIERWAPRPFVLPETVALRPYVFSGPPPRGTARSTAQWKKERR